ncbi:spectrin binding [Trichomonas vaginalis G3]|nr:spectrin binding [Trichomonas vaginalis G3]KAI5523911.1 spectrin binding [Trichomonas vaginalis G3]
MTDKFCEHIMSIHKEINEENVIDIYDCYIIQKDTEKIKECISFFASKMFDLQEEYKIDIIKRFGYDFFEQVLTSESLKVSNEDSLVNTIITLSEYDNSFFSLLVYVRVEYCSNNIIKSIKDFSEKHSLESISNEVFGCALLKRSSIPHKLQISKINYHSAEAVPCKLQLSNVADYNLKTISNKFELSHIEEFHQVDKSDENVRILRSLNKTKDSFDQIYKVLKKASLEEDPTTIKFAVDEKYIDVRDEYEKNMILEAARQNNLCLVKYLFNQDVDIRSRSYTNRTILHYFCQEGNLEGVKFALNFIDINDKNNEDYTPLHDAINYNRIDICKFLISHPNIDKHAKNKNNETPLQYAISLGKQEIVEVLNRNGITE